MHEIFNVFSLHSSIMNSLILLNLLLQVTCTWINDFDWPCFEEQDSSEETPYVKIFSYEECKQVSSLTLQKYLKDCQNSIRILDLQNINLTDMTAQIEVEEIQFMTVNLDLSGCIEFFESFVFRRNWKLICRNILYKKRQSLDSFLKAFSSSLVEHVDLEFITSSKDEILAIFNSFPSSLVTAKLFFDFKDDFLVPQSKVQSLIVTSKSKNWIIKDGNFWFESTKNTYYPSLFKSIHLSLYEFLTIYRYDASFRNLGIYMNLFNDSWDFSMMLDKKTIKTIFDKILRLDHFKSLASSLKQLRINNCRFLLNRHFCGNISLFKKLNSLDLKGCSVRSLLTNNAEWIKSFDTLEYLDISNTNLSAADLSQFFKELLNLPSLNLSDFRVQNMEMNENTFSLFLNVVDRCLNFQVLDFSQFSIESIIYIANLPLIRKICSRIPCIIPEYFLDKNLANEEEFNAPKIDGKELNLQNTLISLPLLLKVLKEMDDLVLLTLPEVFQSSSYGRNSISKQIASFKNLAILDLQNIALDSYKFLHSLPFLQIVKVFSEVAKPSVLQHLLDDLFSIEQVYLAMPNINDNVIEKLIVPKESNWKVKLLDISEFGSDFKTKMAFLNFITSVKSDIRVRLINNKKS